MAPQTIGMGGSVLSETKNYLDKKIKFSTHMRKGSKNLFLFKYLPVHNFLEYEFQYKYLKRKNLKIHENEIIIFRIFNINLTEKFSFYIYFTSLFTC